MKIKKRIAWERIVLSFGLAMVWLAGKSYALDDTLTHIGGTRAEVYASVRFVVVSVIVLYAAAELLNRLTEKPAPRQAYRSRVAFAAELAVLAAVWGVYLAACYPGFMVVDSWWELNEYWGFEAFTTHHPPVHVLLLGICSRIGLWLGDGNIGVFLMVLLQAVPLYLVEAYALYTMRKLCAPRWLYVLTWITLLISPYYVSYFTVVLKDTIYSCAVLLYVLELIYIFVKKDAYWRNGHHLVLWLIANIGVYVMRNNGKYVLVPVAVLMCIRQLRSKRYRVRGLLILLVPVLAGAGMEAFVEEHYNIGKGSIREALSMPFQQTARIVKAYPEEVTDEEHDAIDSVLIYDLIGFLYVPQNADNVKAMYREESTAENLTAYFGTWLEMFFKHPEVYLDATLEQNYYLLDPLTIDRAYYTTLLLGGDYEAVEELTGVHYDGPLFPKLLAWTEAWKKKAFDIPILRMLYNYGFYNVVLLFLLLEAVRKKNRSFLLVAVPLVMSDLIIVAAPLIFYSPRYAFPVLYTLPVVTAFYAYSGRECRTKELQNKREPI